MAEKSRREDIFEAYLRAYLYGPVEPLGSDVELLLAAALGVAHGKVGDVPRSSSALLSFVEVEVAEVRVPPPFDPLRTERTSRATDHTTDRETPDAKRGAP